MAARTMLPTPRQSPSVFRRRPQGPPGGRGTRGAMRGGLCPAPRQPSAVASGYGGQAGRSRTGRPQAPGAACGGTSPLDKLGTKPDRSASPAPRLLPSLPCRPSRPLRGWLSTVVVRCARSLPELPPDYSSEFTLGLFPGWHIITVEAELGSSRERAVTSVKGCGFESRPSRLLLSATKHGDG